MRKFALAAMVLSAGASVTATAIASPPVRHCDQNLPADVGCYSAPHERYCDVLIGHRCVEINRPIGITLEATRCFCP